MARTTISIPDDLKRRMDRVKDPVNWSGVASEAFERKLTELTINRREKTMEAAIARLRASKRESGLDYFALGHARGTEWAKHTAEYAELRRLERFDVVDMLDHFSKPTNTEFSWAELLALKALPGPQAHTRSDAADFWERVGVEDKEQLRSAEFLHGFVKGALEIYEQVDAAP